MKSIRWTAVALLFMIASFATAQEFRDYDFTQERMFCSEDGIYIISSFEDSDHVSAYSYQGSRLWDRPFFAKITSWAIVGNYIIVFSKHRAGYQTYLTCLNRFSGDKIWQQP